MKTIITYGTYDLFHEGHLNILKKARELGDYVIVGVTSDDYDTQRGKLNVRQSLAERIKNVENTGLADKIIVENYLGQKIDDIKKYNADTFIVGDDWVGQFDYLKEYCEVIYNPRTPNISSTKLRGDIKKIGIVGCGRIAKRFMKESIYVSDAQVVGVCGRSEESLKKFSEEFNIPHYEFPELLKKVDAVYIATPHATHYNYAYEALVNDKHVLCEKPATLKAQWLEDLQNVAESRKLIFMEAMKTAYAPAFKRLINVAKSGIIGRVVDVEASFTKLIRDTTLREYDPEQGGALTELMSYPLCVITKVLGGIKEFHIDSIKNKDGVDIFDKVTMRTMYGELATAKVGIGVKTEGDCKISGTLGYIYVPAPWWKTEYFEVRFEDPSENQKYYLKFRGDGLRYELAAFTKAISLGVQPMEWSHYDSYHTVKWIERFRQSL